MYLANDLALYARIGQSARRAFGSVQLEAQISVLARDIRYLELVGIAYRYEHSAVLLHIVTGGGQTFKQRLFQRLAHTQNLTGGLHFRSQLSIQIHQLFKREHRYLNGDVRWRLIKIGAVAHAAQAFAQHAARGQIDHGHAGYLAQVRYGARGARIDLDYVYLMLIYDVLYVDKTVSIQRQSQLTGAFDNTVGYVTVQAARRIYGN